MAGGAISPAGVRRPVTEKGVSPDGAGVVMEIDTRYRSPSPAFA